jgi:S-adenosylmethionine-diacylglycerol 3-amino-3-carboxypropyl transferase
MPSFFETLNYASVNEDWRSEAAALRLGPEDAVVCITGSGERPLDLLATAPARVVSIDRNPAQNHLLALKVAAMRRLSYRAYSEFLGLGPAEPGERRRVFGELAADLAAPSRRFWERHLRRIGAGVVYEGRWERYYRRISAVARLLRPRLVARLFAFEDLEEQRRFLRETWDTFAWRRTYDLFCSPLFSRLFLGDPAYYARAAVRVGRYLYERMLASLSRYLARENFMVSLVLRGVLTPFDLPPYLHPDGFEVIRSRLHHLEIVTGDLEAHLRSSPPGSFDAFSLSDVPSFLDPPAWEGLLDAVLGAASPGARFCIRQFLTRHAVPERLARGLVRDAALEKRLAEEDRAFAYEFIAGSVPG